MAVLELTWDNFEKEVTECDRKVLIDFWAPWCGPCRMMSPVIDEIAEERADVKVCKVNVDEEPQLAMRFEVMSIPTILVFDGGKVAGKSIGAVPKQNVLDLL